MTAQYFTVLTNYGTQAFAKAIATNQPLRLSSFAVGDGNGQAVTPTADRTALVKETHRANVSTVSLDPRNNKQIIIELTIPEDVGGFYIREMGVFDSTNKLVAYANAPESFKPTLESGSGKVQVLRMILKVSNSQAVTLSIDNSVIFVTRQQFNPKKITSSTTNGFDESGHTHEIEKADTTKAGIVQLTDDTGLDSDKLGLSARAGKKLAQLISTVQLALGNYIQNSKKSNSVTSNSNDNVATSSAVKTAYDKGVEAKTAADNAQHTANDGVLRANSAQISANAAQRTANDGVSRANNAQRSADNANTNANRRAAKGDVNVSNLNSLQDTGIFGQSINNKSNSERNYPEDIAGMLIVSGESAYAGQQLYIPYNSGRIYARGKNENGWNEWIRVDGLSKIDESAISHLISGNNKGRVASEFAVGVLNRKIDELIRESHYPRHYSGASVLKLTTSNNKGWKIIKMKATSISIDSSGEKILQLPETINTDATINVTDDGKARFSYGAIIESNKSIKIFAQPNKTIGVNITIIGESQL